MKVFKVYIDDSNTTETEPINAEIFKDLLLDLLQQYNIEVCKVSYIQEL